MLSDKFHLVAPDYPGFGSSSMPSVDEYDYTFGVRNPETIAPENWFNDQYLMDRPGNKDIQLQLFYDYGSNPPLYPKWQAYFREFQPPTLIVWGKNDYIFPEEGAHPYKDDINNIEFHLLDTGHFALEEDGDEIAYLITCFMAQHTNVLDKHPEYREICKLAA